LVMSADAAAGTAASAHIFPRSRWLALTRGGIHYTATKRLKCLVASQTHGVREFIALGGEARLVTVKAPPLDRSWDSR